ncbi:LamG-like jellyroll fold domain-containing protein [Acinetobacter sp. ANC 3781]
MAANILEFAQFGHFDSFDVIRSNTSMASTPDSTLPTPIATGLTTMHYADAAVVENAEYYYKVRVWRGGEFFVSDETVVYSTYDPYADKVKALLRFDGNLDDETGLVWEKPSAIFDVGYFNQAAQLSSRMIAPNTVGAKAFTVEFLYKAVTHSSAYPCVFSFGMAWGVGYIGLYVRRNDTGNVLSCYTYNKPTIVTSIDVLDGEFHHIALAYDGILLRLFVDGVFAGSSNISGFSVQSTILLSDIGQNSITCWLDEFRLTEGEARYTSNFTPPVHPHPAV